jgi:hypothetical protein
MVLIRPQASFVALSEAHFSALHVFVRLALWLGMMPPLCAYVGMTKHGWQLGTVEPLMLPKVTIGVICALYFFALLFGFISAAIIGRWMAGTYGATRDLGAHFALLVVVGAPLVLGSLMHLYPDVFLNLLVLVPCLIWSMFLLYRGLPIVLQTTPEQGMLMASSMIGYLFVAFVSLLGISVCLWVYGIGPRLGV